MLGHQACRCLYYRLASAEYSRTGIDERSAILGDLVRRWPAPGVLGYLDGRPVDPAGARIDSTFAYVGTTAMLEAAGFRRMTQTQSRSAGLPRWLLGLDLAAITEA